MSRKRKKSHNNNHKTIIITIILGILLGICTFFLFNKFTPNKNNKDNNPVEQQQEEKPEVYSTNLIMVGDALIHSSVYYDAQRLANYNGYDFKPQIEYLKEIVSNYDIAYYNQETILGGTSLGLSDYPQFNSPQEVGDAFIDAGFNLVSLATNHTMDRYEQAVLNSRTYWNKQEGVQAVGAYSSYEEKKELETKVLESNGITYAMLNYTYGTNGMPVPSGKNYLVNLWPTDNWNNYTAYKENVKNDVEAIRDKVDVLIVAMHWGVEYTHVPTDYEKDMAKYLADLGVDIIIGTHPHVIQPVEWIDDTIVFYSLGNLISAQYQNQDFCSYYKCVVGLMSSLEITKTVTKDKTEIKIDNIQNDLVYNYYSGWRNFKIIPFSNPEIKTHLSSYQNIYDYYAKIIASDDERINTVPLAA